MTSPLSRLAPACLIVALLGGCVGYTPRPAMPARSHDLPDLTSSGVIGEWQRRLGQHVTDNGGDPAVLSQLPGLRSSGVLRPGQIVFAATDVESFVPERDGFDVFGLLLGKVPGAGGPSYVFVVGEIERRNYRSVGVTDIRLAAMAVRDGTVSWQTGVSDREAIARYRTSADLSAAVRFPADQDQFRIVDCPQGVCVEERVSGARWMLYLGAPVAAAATPAAR